MKRIKRHLFIAPLVVFFATLGMLAAQDTNSEPKAQAPLGIMKTNGVVVSRQTKI